MSGDGLCAGGTCVEESVSISGAASADKVSWAVSEWVDQVARFLGVLQVALEQSAPRDDASAEVRALSRQLPALIRQCRAQVPTPEMIRTWVKAVSQNSADAPVSADA